MGKKKEEEETEEESTTSRRRGGVGGGHLLPRLLSAARRLAVVEGADAGRAAPATLDPLVLEDVGHGQAVPFVDLHQAVHQVQYLVAEGGARRFDVPRAVCPLRHLRQHQRVAVVGAIEAEGEAIVAVEHHEEGDAHGVAVGGHWTVRHLLDQLVRLVGLGAAEGAAHLHLAGLLVAAGGGEAEEGEMKMRR